MTAQECYLLASEDAAEFAELHRSLDESHLPGNAHERILVEEFAHAYWELLRVRRIDREFWQYISSHYQPGETGIAQALAQEKEGRFRIHLRLRVQAEKSYYRALAALERMHRDRDRISNEAARRPASKTVSIETAPVHVPAARSRSPRAPLDEEPSHPAVTSRETPRPSNREYGFGADRNKTPPPASNSRRNNS